VSEKADKSGKPDQPAANPLWGGRFSGGVDEAMERLNASVSFDKRLALYDLRGSRAHVAMLAAQGIVSRADAAAIGKGLDQIEEEIAAGCFIWDTALEDVHMNIEARLAAIIGPAAGRLHTARSRNDQVATDFRLWLRDALDTSLAGVRAVQSALVDLADSHADTLMPGFTHLQTAQPITFGHHLLAYAAMLERDAGRLSDARGRLNRSPLGAAALAGTSYPIDRAATAQALGFDGVMMNSLDAVSSRDFALEALSAASILSTTLSRLAEEIVLWASPGFGFARPSEQFSTGSSIMPQKRNPDAAELIRAKTGRIAGAFQALLMTVKALPLAYSKDLQEDKEPVFDAFDQLDLVLPVMAGMVAALEVDRDAMAAAAGAQFSTATELADWLVQERGLPFREAHHLVGAVVAKAEALGLELAELDAATLQDLDARLPESLAPICDPAAAVARRNSPGGPAPDEVRARIAHWRAHLPAGS
jgi:argininosuccinate lyase